MTENAEDNICRSCLEPAIDKKYPLTGQVVNVDKDVVSMLEFCTSSKLELSDDLPNYVCLCCFKTIRIAYLFLKQFYEAQTKLIQSRKKRDNKENQEETIVHDDCDWVNAHNYCDQNVNGDEHETILIEEITEEDYNDNIDKEINDDINKEINDDINKEINDEIDKKIIDEIQGVDEFSQSNDYEYFTEMNQCEVMDSVIKVEEVELEEYGIGDEDTNLAQILNLESADTDQTKIEIIVDNNFEKSEKCEKVYRYICPICNQKFWRFETFYSHISSYNLPKIKCTRCKFHQEFEIEEYIRHYVDHHKFHCDICDKVMSSSYGYFYHMKHHENVRNYKCPVAGCNRSFIMNHLLKKHVKSHTMTNVYSCKICDSTFKTNDSLRYHYKLHFGKKDHLCTICGQAFYQAVHLRDHMYRHTGYKSFVCDICGKGFITKGSLKKHILYCSRKHNINVMDDT